ncbi:translation initiation factor eIF-2B subunit gamma-like, partial [Trifolium medium]|nr:translation initiation factor eIF-2B subunit gamma-like [Trifolium medium]
MDFQVVVLAGGVSKKLLPLVSKELPNALLPVANRPLLSYV